VSIGSLVLFGSGCGTESPPSGGTPIGGSAGGIMPSNGGGGAAGSAGMKATAGSTAGTTGTAGSTPPAGGAGASGSAGMAAGGAGAPAAGAGGAEAGSGGSPAATGTLPPVTTTDGPGPYTEVVKMMNVPPGGWLIYPKDIGKDGVKHPIFLWGPGGGTSPMDYDVDGSHYERWVSHGIVVYSPSASTGNGTELKAGLDWLFMQNEDMASPLYHKLDTTKVAAAGHSQGSITTFAFATDPRLTTTLHISGGSFDGNGPDQLSKPTAYICGGSDTLAMSNCSRDFTNTSAVPVYFSLMTGVNHRMAARSAWPAMIAWLRWHLAGETQWRKEFLEPTGQFQTGIFQAMIKNW
jgi:hypothetical protein